MTFEEWWNTTGIACIGMQPGDVYRAARDTARAAWEAATKAEREACAQIAKNRSLLDPSAVARTAYWTASKNIAADIRAKGVSHEPQSLLPPQQARAYPRFR